MIPIQRPFLGREELDAVRGVFDSRWLGMGSVTKQFEDRLRDYLGAAAVVAVNTGSSALLLALEALKLSPGDEVIVPSLTFVPPCRRSCRLAAFRCSAMCRRTR